MGSKRLTRRQRQFFRVWLALTLVGGVILGWAKDESERRARPRQSLREWSYTGYLIVGYTLFAAIFTSAFASIAYCVSEWRWPEADLVESPVCASCGYDLTGNFSGVCPECGHRSAGGSADP